MARRGLVSDESEGRDLVLDGAVLVGGAIASNPEQRVLPGDAIAIRSARRRFVSRGGTKLEHALDSFRVDPSGRICLDAGASTGGFTDCLLQRGAHLVFAVDVGKGQMHSRVAADARVVVMDRVNVRNLEAGQIGVRPSVIVADLSFIGLRQVAPALVDLSESGADFVMLVKPQFEARREQVESGGVVRSPKVHAEVLERVSQELDGFGLHLNAIDPSPVTGRAGNIEFFGHWTLGGNAGAATAYRELVSRAVAKAHDEASSAKEEMSL
ncbi:MAG: 16S/23S rRNA (cytidine-2'-O)-methyltransferase [Acidobacteria bacterium]|nr:MAG: 16S/23S rRNA (cytidine-2'-O)-methyltransferase [Acidobacteriota bacterium]